jgi:hypothetical protein
MPEHNIVSDAVAPSERVVLRMVFMGVVLIFGGEAVCIFGPHENAVDVGCHAVLYLGIGFVSVGALLQVVRRLRALRYQPDR